MEATDPQWYELRDSVFSRAYARADELLRDRPGLLHLVNPLGETVLHFLAVEDDLEGVSWLFGKGAELNSRNAFGTPLIFEVAQVASEGLFAWLLEHGANAETKGMEGEDIVEYLQKFDHDERIEWVRKYLA
jgi:hypothetical protein